MSDDLLKYGAFLLFFGVLNRRHFDLSPVWCEYYKPSEMDDIEAPKDWINSNLIEPLNRSDDRAYYASLSKIDYSKREFLSVLCELILNGRQYQGYLYLIQGKINSVSIFLGEEIVDFYSSDMLSEDNVKALEETNKFSGLSTAGGNSIKYTIKDSSIDFIRSEGEFLFPID